MSEYELKLVRRRSLETVQMIFGAMAVVCLILAGLFYTGDIGAALPEGEAQVIANSFLAVAALDTAMIFVWERLSAFTSTGDRPTP